MHKVESRQNLTRKLALTALFTALIVVGGFLNFPLGAVPISLQMLFVLLAGNLGGKKIGACAVLIYLLLGLIGLPVFALGGGVFYVFKPTFGYLIGFLLTVIVAGVKAQRLWTKTLLNFVAVLLTHVVGVTYLYLISNLYLVDPISLKEAIIFGSLVFLPSDVLFVFVASILSFKLNKIKKPN